MRRIISILLLALSARADLPYINIDSDVQKPATEFRIERTFAGNTPMIRWTVTDAGAVADTTGWAFTLWYAKSSSATSGVPVPQYSVSSNVILFRSLTNFFSAPNDYYCSILGTHTSGAVRTWAVGSMQQRFDAASSAPRTNSFNTPFNWNAYGPYAGTPPIFAADSTIVVASNTPAGTFLRAVASGGTGTLYEVASDVPGLYFDTGKGPTARLTGTVATAATTNISQQSQLAFTNQNTTWYLTGPDFTLASIFASSTASLWTAISARLASNVWAAADSTTNFAARTAYVAATNALWGNFANYVPTSGSVVTMGDLYLFDPLLEVGFYFQPSSDYIRLFAGGCFLTVSNNGAQLTDDPQFAWRGNFQGNGSGLTNAVSAGNGLSLTSGRIVALSNSVTLSGTVTAGGFVGNGAGLTNLPSSGSLANQRSFEWRDAEGSVSIGWTKQLAAGLNLLSIRTPTNDLTFAAYGTTASTTLQTSTVYVVFEHQVTGAIPWAVKSSQAVSSGLVIFTPKDGQNFGAAITQTLAAASTLYLTNQTLAITAKTATIEVRIATTNAANLFQLGVDVQ